MVYALRPEHPLAAGITALFELERQQADAVLQAVRRAATRLTPAPLAVWLYGSVARGEDQPTSDIDIALVSALPDPGPQAEILRKKIARALPEREQRVSVIALAPSDVRRMAREGADLWNALVHDAAVLAGYDPVGLLEQVSGGAASA